MKQHVKKNAVYDLIRKELDYKGELIDKEVLGQLKPLSEGCWKLVSFDDNLIKKLGSKEKYNEIELINLIDILKMTEKIKPNDYEHNIYIKKKKD